MIQHEIAIATIKREQALFGGPSPEKDKMKQLKEMLVDEH
jgi:hypothetical protein